VRDLLVGPSAEPGNGHIADRKRNVGIAVWKGGLKFRGICGRIGSELFGLRLSVARLGVLIAEKGIITAENFGALMISYSEIGGHVLTPFLGTCPCLVKYGPAR